MPPGFQPLRVQPKIAASPKMTESRVMAMAAAPMVMAAGEPELPYMARMTSMVITNLPMFKLTIKYDAQVYGFGVAYSDDLQTWNVVGEAQWTNAAPENPFLYAGTTEHRIWIDEPQWQVTHRPNGTTTNLWKITLIDKTAKQAKRFYKIYPIGPVTGLPYP